MLLRVLAVSLALWGAASAAFVVVVLVNRQPTWEQTVAAQLAQAGEDARAKDERITALMRELDENRGVGGGPLVIDGKVFTCWLSGGKDSKVTLYGTDYTVPDGFGAIVVDTEARTITRDPTLQLDECE